MVTCRGETAQQGVRGVFQRSSSIDPVQKSKIAKISILKVKMMKIHKRKKNRHLEEKLVLQRPLALSNYRGPPRETTLFFASFDMHVD